MCAGYNVAQGGWSSSEIFLRTDGQVSSDASFVEDVEQVAFSGSDACVIQTMSRYLFRQLVSGLQHLHHNNLYHRDLKVGVCDSLAHCGALKPFHFCGMYRLKT